MVQHYAGRLLGISEHSKTLLPKEMLTSGQITERITLPINLGGFGLRPLQRVSHAAYLSSLLAAMPDVAASASKAPGGGTLRADHLADKMVHSHFHADHMHVELSNCLAYAVWCGLLGGLNSRTALRAVLGSLRLSSSHLAEIVRLPSLNLNTLPQTHDSLIKS